MNKTLRVLMFSAAGPLALAACGGGSGGAALVSAPQSTDTDVLPAGVASQIEQLVREKQTRTPAQKKIASQLLYTQARRFAADAQAVKAQTPGSKNDDTQIRSLLQVDEQGRVLCEVTGDLGGGLERRIDEAQGQVVASSVSAGSVRAWLPLGQLETLAAQPVVKAIRPALPPHLNRADLPGGNPKFHVTREQQIAQVQAYLKAYGATRAVRPAVKLAQPHGTDGSATYAAPVTGSVTSQGAIAHGAARARKFYNADGTGITVGVLSDSDDGKEGAIVSHDLPADTVTVPGQDGRPAAGEGTALMEVVHDMAPGAKLVFATGNTGAQVFADNIRTLRNTYHADIIIDDLQYYAETPFQDDVIAQAVNAVSADGALYISSAGNNGNYDDGTSGVWEGDFKGAGTLATLPSGYTVQDLGAKVISNRVEVESGPVLLSWSDPGSADHPQSSNDYDLFVLDEDLRNVVLASTDVQDGAGLPLEELDYLIPPNYRIVVAKHPAAQNRAIRVQLYGGELGLSTPGAVFGHAAADKALAIAAVDVAEAAGGEFTGGPTTPVETYSSDGSRQVFYNADGTKIHGGVTFASGGGATRAVASLAAADGVATTLPANSSLNPFFGTSAAAAHAAGIAALVKSAVPTLSSDQLSQALTDGALDIEAKGRDRDSGAGVMSAFNSLKAAGAKSQVFLELASVQAQKVGGGVVVPGSSGQIATTLINNGGANANAVSGTLTSLSPYVTVTRATTSYPNAGAGGGTAAAAQSFLFTVDPAVACGAQLSFQEAVKFNGRGTNPTNLAFSVQTGTASSASTTFSYAGAPADIPDGDSVGVNLPVTVSGIPLLAKLLFRIDGDACTANANATTVGLSHTWVGDLTLTLISPAGTAVTLMRRPGGPLNDGNNFCQTLLQDDGATTSIQDITDAGAPYTGTYAPATPLAAFNGEDPSGVWTLNVTDGSLFDTGTVRAFSISASQFTCTP